MDSSIHQTIIWCGKGLEIFLEQFCHQLIIALFYNDSIFTNIPYLCTEVCGNAMLFSIYQNDADNSYKMKSEYWNIRNGQHQRTVMEMTLRSDIFFWERTAAVSFNVSNPILENILMSIDCDLSVDSVPHTVNTVLALH